MTEAAARENEALVDALDFFATDAQKDGLRDVLPKPNELSHQAATLVVENAEQYAAGGELLRQILDMKNQVGALMDPVCKRAHETHKAATGARAKMLDPLERAEAIVKKSLGAYLRARQEEEANERRLAEAAAAAAIEASRLERAVELEAQGRETEAARLLETPVIAPTIAPARVAPKVDGIGTKKTWKFEVVDPALVNRKFLVLDEALIRKTVAALGADAAALVGGIRVFEDTEVRGAAKRMS